MAIGRKMGTVIRQCVKKEAKAIVVLSFGGTVLDVRPSPVVAAFSSRGPNAVTLQILKPDVIGLGVNILAGWSKAVGPTRLDSDSRKTEYLHQQHTHSNFHRSILLSLKLVRVGL